MPSPICDSAAPLPVGGFPPHATEGTRVSNLVRHVADSNWVPVILLAAAILGLYLGLTQPTLNRLDEKITDIRDDEKEQHAQFMQLVIPLVTVGPLTDDEAVVINECLRKIALSEDIEPAKLSECETILDAAQARSPDSVNFQIYGELFDKVINQ